MDVLKRLVHWAREDQESDGHATSAVLLMVNSCGHQMTIEVHSSLN